MTTLFIYNFASSSKHLPRSSVGSNFVHKQMASLLKHSTFSSIRAHHQGLPLQTRRQIHVEAGAREKALLAKDPALERFKSYRKSASSIRRIGDYLTIAVVAGCCYEIYVRAVTREEARKALKSK